MPALFRMLALLGGVLGLLLAAPGAGAQSSPDQAAPTTGLPTITAIPPAAPPPEAAPLTIDENAAAPDVTTPATPHKTTHKKTGHKKSTAAHHTSKKHKTSKSAKKGTPKGDAHLRDAQMHLANLDYYKAKVDGLNGPKTRDALKAFQKDHKLAVTGKLTPQTYDAIIAADKQKAMSSLPVVPPIKESMVPQVIGAEPQPPEAPPIPQGPDFYATHPDFYGHYNQSYENPLVLGPTQTLYSRYAKVELTEDQSTSSPTKKYNITLNGLPLVLVDNQPSVIGVSRTFQVGDEDVLIFTSFKDNDPVCAYDYNLLILAADGTKTRQITECTRGYQAKEANGTLLITFPESDNARAAGSVWKYDHGDLQKL